MAAALAALVALACQCGAAQAAGAVRDNPFRPDTTAEEDQAIANRNVAAATVKELLPEVITEVGRAVGRDQKTAMDMLKQSMEAQMASQAKQVAQAGPAAGSVSSLRSSAAPNVEKMKFYACANGKALYKDSGGALVVAPPPTADQPSPCP